MNKIERDRKYRLDNSEIIDCECGSKIVKYKLYEHIKSKKHLEFEQSKLPTFSKLPKKEKKIKKHFDVTPEGNTELLEIVRLRKERFHMLLSTPEGIEELCRTVPEYRIGRENYLNSLEGKPTRIDF